MLTVMDGGGGSSVVAVGGAKLLFVKEDVEATATRLDAIAEDLGSSLMSAVPRMAGLPAGAEEVSSLAVSNLTQSASSLEARVRQSITELKAAAANMRANAASYTSSDGI